MIGLTTGWKRNSASAAALAVLLSASTAARAEPDAKRSPKTEPISSAELGDAGPFEAVRFGSGWEFRTADGKNMLALRFRMQNRADVIHTVDPAPGTPEWAHEMQVRRMRVRLNGHVVDPKLRYLVQLSFSRRDMDWDASQQPNVLRDAMITYDVLPNWQVGFGQGKLPGNRQRVVSSGDLQFVDRSIVNAAFNVDRDFGFQTQYRAKLGDQLLIAKAAVISGEGRNGNARSDGRLATAARVEWLPFGEFSRSGDYFESDLAREPSPKLSIGYAYAAFPGTYRANGTVGTFFTEDGTRSGTPARTDMDLHFADAVFKWQGWSAYVEWARRDATRVIMNSKQAALEGQGYNVQLGRMVSDDKEVALKHSAVLPRGLSVGRYSEDRDWAAVFNWFVNGHRVKLQGEVGLIEAKSQYARFQVELGI